MAKGSHNYMLERSYYYDSHDENKTFNGLTVDEWKEKILNDWSADSLKSNHVTIIFHDSDKDENGNEKVLHAHACANTVDTISQSAMMKLSKCTCEENCTVIKNKANSYAYLLHVTTQAIADKKHIYGEDCLIFSVADGKSFNINDYHNIIAKKKGNDDSKDDKALIDDTLGKILDAQFGDGLDDSNNVFGSVSEQRIYEDILMNHRDIIDAMSRSPQLHKKVMNAIKMRADMTRVGLKHMQSAYKART